MLFTRFLFLVFFPNIHTKLITYTLFQTDDICQHNWKGSICLPIFPLNKTYQQLSIELDIDNNNSCLTHILVYIRTRHCIYCPKNLDHIHCNHQRSRRMISKKRDLFYQNQTFIIGICLFSILIIGSLFTLFFIKRSQAHTNLLELYNHQDTSNSNIQSMNHIKVHGNIKSAHVNLPEPRRLIIPNKIKTTK